MTGTDAKYTIYTAPTSVPMIDQITEDGTELLLPDGYEADADQITLVEDHSNTAQVWLTLQAEVKGFVLDRLASKLSRDVPVRMLLVGYPENGVTHAIHLPTSMLEGSVNEDMLIVYARPDRQNNLPVRRDFWFGPYFNPVAMGFTPIEEGS